MFYQDNDNWFDTYFFLLYKKEYKMLFLIKIFCDYDNTKFIGYIDIINGKKYH